MSGRFFQVPKRFLRPSRVKLAVWKLSIIPTLPGRVNFHTLLTGAGISFGCIEDLRLPAMLELEGHGVVILPHTLGDVAWMSRHHPLLKPALNP